MKQPALMYGGHATVNPTLPLHEARRRVAFRAHVEATHSGEFMGSAPAGRRIFWDAVNIVYVRDGRVVEQWAQPDPYGVRPQLLGDAESRVTPAAKEAVTGGD